MVNNFITKRYRHFYLNFSMPKVDFNNISCKYIEMGKLLSIGALTKFFNILFFIALCAALQGAVPANAQPLPGAADPGRIIRDLDPSLQQPLPEETVPEMTAPLQTTSEAPEGSEDVTFVLKDLQFSGNTVFTREELASQKKELEGKTVSLKDMFDLAAYMTNEYRRRGYFLSRAYLPPQEIEDGTVTLNFAEGYIERVVTEGVYKNHPVIRATIKRIQNQRPANIAEIERYLLELNDLTGLSAESVLEPGQGSVSETPAIGMRLMIDSDPKPVFSGYAAINNGGSKYIGPFQAEGQVMAENLFGLYGQTSVSATSAVPMEELAYFALQHSMPLTRPGLKLTGNVSYSRSKPGFTLKPSDIASDTYSGSLRVTQALIRSRDKNLYLEGMFDVKNVGSDIATNRLYDDRLRVFRAGLSFDSSDIFYGGGSNQLSGTVSQGLNVLGARKSGSADLSRLEGRSDFTKIEGSFSRLQRAPLGLNLYTAVRGQYTNDVLLSSEEIGFGGPDIGRAYDGSEISGDRGIVGTIEVRFPRVESSQVSGRKVDPPFSLLPDAFMPCYQGRG
jgi:hemolysin activation/secretion protein